MQRHDKILVAVTVGLLVYTLLLFPLGSVISSLVTSRILGNTGIVEVVGAPALGVYWDSKGTNPVTSFTWGVLKPGSTQNMTCYVANSGNAPVTLSITTQNWSPSNAVQYMKFGWNLGGQTLSLGPGQIKKAIFTLQILASVTGITNFSFNVIIGALASGAR